MPATTAAHSTSSPAHPTTTRADEASLAPARTALATATPAPDPAGHLLFVYGTLKTGCCNHAQLAGQHFLAVARTTPHYQLYALDGYPGLVTAPATSNPTLIHAPDDALTNDLCLTPAAPAQAIWGELWSVSPAALARLDAFEGIDEQLYRRAPISLAPPHDGLRVESYFYLRSLSGRRQIGTTWTEPAPVSAG